LHAAGIDSRRALRSFSDGSTVVTAGGTSKLRRERSQEEQQSPPKNYCTIIGIFFLIAGISGFVPALAPSPADGAMLFGIFMVGPVHNIIHLYGNSPIMGVMWKAAALAFRRPSLADDLHEDALLSAPIEFAVEDLFPRAEIQFAGGNSYHHFAAHDLTLQVRVGVVFAGTIVPVDVGRRMRRQLFEPDLIVVMQTGFIVVDEHRSGDVHCVHQAKALCNAAALDEFVDRRRDVDEAAPRRHFEPEVFS